MDAATGEAFTGNHDRRRADLRRPHRLVVYACASIPGACRMAQRRCKVCWSLRTCSLPATGRSRVLHAIARTADNGCIACVAHQGAGTVQALAVSPGESDVICSHAVAIALATRRAVPGGAVTGCVRACAAAQPAGPVGTLAQLRRAAADPDRAALHRPAIGDAEPGQLRGRNSGGRVSAHYLIGEDGARYQLVSDDQRAWHGGAGRWGTITDINSASIGIELDNDGSEPFAPAQIDSLLVLLDDLCTRLRIPRTQIVGHEDVAPTRKNDPGPLFPWKRLADAGFGRWPAADAPAAPAVSTLAGAGPARL